MTVEEYNHDFLPRIQRAKEFVSLFESSINHMDNSRVDKNEVRRQFKIRCWSEETKQMILTALDYYKRHEGLEKLNYECPYCESGTNGFKAVNQTAKYSGIEMAVNRQGMLRARVLGDDDGFTTQDIVEIYNCPLCGRRFVKG